MKELIPTINEVIKYGLHSNLTTTDKEKLLERHLVKIYDLYFEIDYEFDDTDYAAFDKSQFPDIRENVARNFPDFGFYKTVLDIQDIENNKESEIGDAIDDLSDIIFDLLEIKWRIENNSLADGLWYFQLVFFGHTREHVIALLNFIKN